MIQVHGKTLVMDRFTIVEQREKTEIEIVVKAGIGF
jgi:hypothetical protein